MSDPLPVEQLRAGDVVELFPGTRQLVVGHESADGTHWLTVYDPEHDVTVQTVPAGTFYRLVHRGLSVRNL